MSRKGKTSLAEGLSNSYGDARNGVLVDVSTLNRRQRRALAKKERTGK